MLLQCFASGLCFIPLPRRRIFPSEVGQGLVEYAAILVLVAILVVVVLGVFGLAIKDNLYQNIINAI